MIKIHILFFFFVSTSTVISQNKDVFDIGRNGTVDELKKVYNENPDVINTRNDAGYSSLILACYHDNNAVAEFLINNVNDINGSSQYGTPLMAAVVKANTKIVQMLLNKKANPNVADANGTTALHYAVIFQNIDIVDLLIKAKADSNIKDNKSKSPLDYAIITKNEKLLNILREQKL